MSEIKELVPLLKEALKLELSTDAGKINLFVTLGILVLGALFLAAEVPLALIWAWLLKEKIETLHFTEVLVPFLFIGLACFFYHVKVAEVQRNIKKHYKKTRIDPKQFD